MGRARVDAQDLGAERAIGGAAPHQQLAGVRRQRSPLQLGEGGGGEGADAGLGVVDEVLGEVVDRRGGGGVDAEDRQEGELADLEWFVGVEQADEVREGGRGDGAGVELGEGLGGDLLELYCGNGNFTVALAPQFGRVLATEVSKPSVAAAEFSLEANAIDNVTMVRMSSDEISDALAGGRDYRRMRHVDLSAYAFTTLFVDPPRSGLDPLTVELARGFDNILYISCNPRTLQENVAALYATHRIAAAAAFDQFPYTHHLECGLLLQKRAASATQEPA